MHWSLPTSFQRRIKFWVEVRILLSSFRRPHAKMRFAGGTHPAEKGLDSFLLTLLASANEMAFVKPLSLITP